jgi:hypothetical protein
MSMPAASACLASAFGKAEPPITIFSPLRSTLAAAAALSSIRRMVGTPWVKVTPSLLISLTSIAGS